MLKSKTFIHVEKNNFFQHRKTIRNPTSKAGICWQCKCSQRPLQLHSWELLEATTLHLISFTAEVIWLCIPQEVVPTFK